MKIFLLTFFAAVYYGAWWLMKHNQDIWAFVIFVPCTFVLFPLLWALFANGPAGTPVPVRSDEDMALDNVLIPAADLEDNGATQDAWQAFPDLPDDDEPARASPQAQTPEQQPTAADPHMGQKELF
jgi:hypothetical protein